MSDHTRVPPVITEPCQITRQASTPVITEPCQITRQAQGPWKMPRGWKHRQTKEGCAICRGHEKSLGLDCRKLHSQHSPRIDALGTSSFVLH